MTDPTSTPAPDPVPYAQHEREVLEVIDERDRVEGFADRLAEAISALLGVPIGEHSSTNNPWQSALGAATAHLTALKPAVRPVEPSAVPAEGSELGAMLRAAAEGRREYALDAPEDMRPVLEQEATTLESAARLADGDMSPMYGWLPSWRWTSAMFDAPPPAKGFEHPAADPNP